MKTLLRLIELQDLREENRAEGADGGAQANAQAVLLERQEFDRIRLRLPVLHADLVQAGIDPVVGLAGRAEAGDVALDVDEEDRNACVRELLGQELQCLCLARPGGSGDQPMAADHLKWNPHACSRVGLAADGRSADFQHRHAEAVPVLDDLLKVGSSHRFPPGGLQIRDIRVWRVSSAGTVRKRASRQSAIARVSRPEYRILY